jgi:putative phage-type endonuclease
MEELACGLIHEYYNTNVGWVHTEEFEQGLLDDVRGLMDVTLGETVDEEVVEDALDLFRFYAPCRTSGYAPGQPGVAEIMERLTHLPALAQRSPEWYAFRHGLITASNIYKTFGSPSKQNEIICEKCGPLVVSAPSADGPRHWGVRYEPVSVMYYEATYKTKIQEFGCVAHPLHPFIGASPDGINTDVNPALHGRMLEIKNPFSRTITGAPKEEYWVQMQVQMEVCDLNACDFLETQFVEYASHADFVADGTFGESAAGEPKGVILVCAKNEATYYEYAPYQCTEEVFNEWEEGVLKSTEWLSTIYWKLAKVSCILVERNRAWFAAQLPEIARVWGIIVEERETGKWVERLPKKRAQKVVKRETCAEFFENN